MINEGKGNLLQVQADALVNTVNTVGVMGKGVALQFKQAFPENFNAYARACKAGDVRVGHMFVTHTGMLQPRIIVNFPTKRHWKEPSKLEDIRAGLVDLVRVVRDEKIQSIAMPPLGCGLGGLRWEEVEPMIREAFAPFPDVEVTLFPPGGAPAPSDRIVRTAKPALTPWSAALIRIVRSYMLLGFEATHLEAQKLLYFLKEAGEPVKGEFKKGPYGPYDENMKFGLLRLEGHYINGFGDGDRLDPVTLVPGAEEDANRLLADSPETEDRIRRVERLIDGFESPYGLELLATIHYVATRNGAQTSDDAVQLTQQWSPRKKRALKEPDLRAAWNRLTECGWISLGA